MIGRLLTPGETCEISRSLSISINEAADIRFKLTMLSGHLSHEDKLTENFTKEVNEARARHHALETLDVLIRRYGLWLPSKVVIPELL